MNDAEFCALFLSLLELCCAEPDRESRERMRQLIWQLLRKE